MNTIEIAGRKIGRGQPCFLIAEAGVNHNGDLGFAYHLIDTAAAAGADAVKFQTFRAEALVSPVAPKADYQKRLTDPSESQLEMLRRLELSHEDHQRLFEHAQTRGLLFLSTPFDEQSANFLQELGVAAFKIASGELINLPLLAHVAGKGRPMILSTGMSTLEEVEQAVATVRESGNPPLALLHCVSCYPAQPEEANLRAIQTLAERFEVPAGFSDHTEGIAASIAAVALGASIVEKHFTLDKNQEGPDHQASLDPVELVELVRSIRQTERALGHGRKEPMPRELENAAVIRKSLAAACDIPAGSFLSREMLTALRPGTGISPTRLAELVGRQTQTRILKGELILWEMVR